MSDYYNRSSKRKKRSRREKIGFYTAFSICLIAVCMAVYSTYNTLQTPSETASTTQQVNQVNNNVTGVTETSPQVNLDLTVPTIAATGKSQAATEKSESATSPSKSALQTMLSTDVTLGYPLSTKNVMREYSEDSVYFKTLNVWKPHTGVDFAGELGEDVSAMAGGAITKVKDDKLYGKTVEISTNDVICTYSGLESVSVKEGDSVEKGGKVGVLGSVPCEAGDKNHIHVSVKVNGKYADPLSFIGNDE